MYEHGGCSAAFAVAGVDHVWGLVECEVWAVEEEGGVVWVDGRQAVSFALFLFGLARFLLLSGGTGAALSRGVDYEGYGLVAFVFGVDVVRGVGTWGCFFAIFIFIFCHLGLEASHLDRGRLW
jgi:hypothetical protein